MITTSLLLAALVWQAQSDTLSAEARRVLADLRYLADDARQGRGLGSRGLEEAGAYVAAAFERIGLRPGAADGWFQDFTVSPDAPAVAHAGLPATATRNVVAILPGRSPALRGQAVVIGAHYDHLGLGGPTALDPDSTGAVHNGADDNASGTAALLEIARRLAAAQPARTIVFVAFSGEELGVLGSTYYVKNPTPVPIDSVYAMINLDMVGRLREGKLLALGAETAVELRSLLDSINGGAAGTHGSRRFDLRASGDGWGPSDHASFYAAKRPVVHFFTDLHDDYHRTTDDWQRINAPGIVQVAAYVADLGLALADRAGALTFVDVPRPQLASGRSTASLGTIPDMSESPGGVRLTGVRAGGPGDLAGIRAGDIIVGIGTHTVANLYDMSNALNAHQPGDTVVVTVRRGTEEIKVTAVLGRRGS